MDDSVPTTGGAVIIVVAFLLPGFVTVLLQERAFKSADDPTPLDRLLRIVWYSAWSYILLAIAAIIFRVHRHDIVHLYHEYRDAPAELVWRGALAILVPAIVIEEVTRWWHRSSWRTALLEKARINSRHTVPTAWDYFMRQGHDCYVRVTFADGTRVLGYYGSESFAAYAKDGRDLYLERTFVPNNDEDQWFGDEVPGNSGVWVRTADAISVEFYTPMHGTGSPKASGTTAETVTAAAATTAGGAGRAHGAEAQSGATSAAAPAEEGLDNV